MKCSLLYQNHLLHAQPMLSKPHGLYKDPMLLIMTPSTFNRKIYYTTDGSEPTINSTLYNRPFIINETTIIRYAQFGCMTACMINGGENGPFSAHLSWTHGNEVEEAYRWCVTWMKSLMPYKFSTVVDAHLHGGSLIKGTNLEERSHLLGNDIFTKVIISDDGKATYHLPDEGEWVDYWTGKEFQAGTTVTDEYPVNRFPLFIRSGAIIPMTDASMPGKRIFRIWPNGKTSRHFHLPKGDGIEYFDCTVSYDQRKGCIILDSEESANFVFIVGKKSVSATGKHVEKTL